MSGRYVPARPLWPVTASLPTRCHGEPRTGAPARSHSCPAHGCSHSVHFVIAEACSRSLLWFRRRLDQRIFFPVFGLSALANPLIPCGNELLHPWSPAPARLHCVHRRAGHPNLGGARLVLFGVRNGLEPREGFEHRRHAREVQPPSSRLLPHPKRSRFPREATVHARGPAYDGVRSVASPQECGLFRHHRRSPPE